MTEEQLNALRQQDTNLRDAIWQEEEVRPQMPADLNERLMQRVAAQQEKKPRRIVWPWIAAACAAGVLMIWLTPPKVTETDVVAKQQPKVEQPAPSSTLQQNGKEEVRPEAPQQVEETPVEVKPAKVTPAVTKPAPSLLVQETPATEPTAAPKVEEAPKNLVAEERIQPQQAPVMLTERDIPITRPENFRYTPEELALMKKQANEAYLKWVELELEIAKFDLENTAQK